MRFAGNDIVDLNEEEAVNKHFDARFMNRVFNRQERQIIAGSADPNRILWMIWAAKEAAYKIISKKFSNLIFSPQEFEVKNFSEVHYEKKTIEIKIDSQQNFIHAVGVSSEGTGVRKMKSSGLSPRFTEQESESIQSVESAWVRYFAKQDLSRKLGIAFKEIKIIRAFRNGKWQPPAVFRNDSRMNIDISLSHHGKWVAWVWTLLNQP